MLLVRMVDPGDRIEIFVGKKPKESKVIGGDYFHGVGFVCDIIKSL